MTATSNPARQPIDPRHAVRTLLLAAWTGLFVWLLLSGRVVRYIGPRTTWVVVCGAVALGAAAVAGSLDMRRVSNSAPLSPGEVGGWAALLAPLLLVAAVPEPSLGSLAASRKSAGGIVSVGLAPPITGSGGPVSFKEIEYASQSAAYASQVGITDGYRVRLTGFVTHPEGISPGSFALTRFAIFCCAADAVPYSVEVDGSKLAEAAYPDDTWLIVSGILVRSGDTLVLEASSVRKVPEPADPYL